MKIVFMGTPDYAVKTLEALIDAGHEIAAHTLTHPFLPRYCGLSAEYAKGRQGRENIKGNKTRCYSGCGIRKDTA